MILIDTHVWIWFLVADRRLSGFVLDTLLYRPSEVYLSPITVWEAAYLAQTGKINLGNQPLQTIRAKAEESEFIPAKFNHEIALLSRELPFEHDDPADRFLAATAKAYGIPLATADEKLKALPWLNTV